jgi:hypothetical protein
MKKPLEEGNNKFARAEIFPDKGKLFSNNKGERQRS